MDRPLWWSYNNNDPTPPQSIARHSALLEISRLGRSQRARSSLRKRLRRTTGAGRGGRAAEAEAEEDGEAKAVVSGQGAGLRQSCPFSLLLLFPPSHRSAPLKNASCGPYRAGTAAQRRSTRLQAKARDAARERARVGGATDEPGWVRVGSDSGRPPLRSLSAASSLALRPPPLPGT